MSYGLIIRDGFVAAVELNPDGTIKEENAMGRLTEHLRSEGVCRGCDYELQGGDAKREATPSGVTSDVQGNKVGPTGPLIKPGSTMNPADLHTKLGPG